MYRSQVRFCNVDEDVPRVEALVDETVDIFGKAQPRQSIAEVLAHLGGWERAVECI